MKTTSHASHRASHSTTADAPAPTALGTSGDPTPEQLESALESLLGGAPGAGDTSDVDADDDDLDDGEDA